MEASPKLSPGDDDGATAIDVEELAERRQEIHDYKSEPFTHYLDRISSKEGYRAGIYWTSGDHYLGEWHLNLRHGRGINTYRNGNVYEGEWKHGKRDGHGTLWIKSPNKECRLVRKYRGSWNAGVPGGHGSYYGVGGELYTGQSERGKRHGIGKQTYRDWNVKDKAIYHTYYGHWVNGKREGLGQLIMSNRNVYQGGWKNDWKEGNGVFFFVKSDPQSKYEGWWRDDRAVSGVYSHCSGIESEQLQLPVNLWLPGVTELSKEWMEAAALRLPPARFDVAKRRTDLAVATRKFARTDIVYGSLLHGPMQFPDIPFT